MPINFFPPFLARIAGVSSSDPEQAAQTGQSTFGLAARIATLAPIGIGIHSGFKALGKGSPGTFASLGTNAISSMAGKVGANIEVLSQAQEKIRQGNIDNYRDLMRQGGHIKEVLSKGNEDTQKFLNALLVELEGKSDVGNARRIIMDLMETQSFNVTADEEKILTQTARNLIEADELGAARLRRAENLFGGILNQLVPPTEFRGLNPNLAVATKGQLGAGGSAMLGRLEALAGNNPIELRRIQETAKGFSYYGVVRPGGGQALTVPLQLARHEGAPILRLGESMSTTYVGFRGYGVGEAMSQATMPELQQQLKTGGQAIFGVEEWFMREAERVLGPYRKNLGGVAGGTIKDLHAFGRRGVAYQLPRVGRPTNAGDPAFAAMQEHLGNVARLKSQGVFIELSGMESTAASELTSRLVARPGTPFTAGAAADILREDFSNRAFTQVAINDPDSGFLGVTRALGPQFAHTRVTLPATARVKQMIGRESRYLSNDKYKTIGRAAAGGGAWLQTDTAMEFASDLVRKGGITTAVVMDVKGGGRRLGLGEGMAYWGMQPSVENIITKTVIDPADLNRQGSLLMEELKTRRTRNLGALKIGSELTEETRALAKTRGINIGKKINSVDDLFRVFGGENKFAGLFLGELDNNELVKLARYSDLDDIALQLEGTSEAMGRRRFHVSARLQRGAFGDKGFSIFNKGTHGVAQLSMGMAESVYKRLGYRGREDTGILNAMRTMMGAGSKKTRNRLGRKTMITPGSMLSKGPWYQAMQMVSGTALIMDPGHALGRYTGPGMTGIEAFYKQIGAQMQGGTLGVERAFMGDTAKGQQRRYLSSVMEAVGGELKANKWAATLGTTEEKVAAEMMGMVFGGIHETAKGFGWKDRKSARGKTITVQHQVQSEIRRVLSGGALSSGFIEKVVRSAQRGVAVGVNQVFPDDPATTYRATQAAMEPRYFQFLSHKLQSTLGLSPDATADFMTSVLTRKPLIAQELEALRGITKTVESLSGKSVLGRQEHAALGRVSATDFVKEVGGNEQAAREFMQRFDKGVILDFAGEADPVKGITRHFGGAKEVLLPGGSVVNALRGTEISTRTGKMVIEDELVRRVADFSKNLQTVSQAMYADTNELVSAQARAGKFREDMAQMFGFAWKGILKGKLEGTVMAQGAGINLRRKSVYSYAMDEMGNRILDEHGRPTKTGVLEGRTAGIGKTAARRMRAAQSKTAGGGVFASGQAFLDAMRSYSGGIKGEGALGGPAKQEISEAFQSFFLGMEGKGRVRGWKGILSRHPLLGAGHMDITEIFRYDAGKGKTDQIWESFVKSDAGKGALTRVRKALSRTKRSGKGLRRISSFKDLQTAWAGGFGGETEARQKAVRSFFGSMAENITQYAGEGGGKIYIPDWEVDVHFTSGEKHTYNLSKAAGMIGDFDGDFYQLHFMSKRQGEMLGDAAMKQMQMDDLVFNAQTRHFMEEVGGGIKRLEQAGGRKDLTPGLFKYHENLKEVYAKQIGQVDVALDAIRLGMVHSAGSEKDIAMANRSMAFLNALEESVIKSKKLPRAYPIAEMLSNAVKASLQGKDDALQGFRHVVEHGILHGSPLVEGGVGIDWNQTMKSMAKSAGGRESDAYKNLHKALQGLEANNLDEMFAFMSRAVGVASDIGLDRIKTLRSLGKWGELKTADANKYWMHMVHHGNAIEGALARGDADFVQESNRVLSDFMRRTGGAIQTLDKRLLGPVGLGVMGALALGAAVGSPGYAPSPLMMPGEMLDPAVGSAIASGSLRERSQRPPGPEDMRPGPHTNIMNRPINIGETYFQKQNAYQIRGHVASSTGLNSLISKFTSHGVSTSVRLNDTRQPITRNYIDRIVGE